MKCSYASCPNSAVHMERHCWRHLSERKKKTYPARLLRVAKARKSLDGLNFRGVVLVGINFPDFTTFQRCDFRKAMILTCSFRHANFAGANLSGACLKRCHFEDSDFSEFDDVPTSMKFSDLRESYFNRSNLQNADFTGADMRDTVLVDVDMTGCNLLGARLYSSRIMSAKIRKESFCNFVYRKSRYIRIGDERFRQRLNHAIGPCGAEGPEPENEPRPLRAKMVYTTLKNNFRSNGDTEDLKWAYRREQVMERKRLFRLWRYGDREADMFAIEHWHDDRKRLYESRIYAGFRWGYEWLRTLLSYGTDVKRLLMTSLIIIFIFGLLYFFEGTKRDITDIAGHPTTVTVRFIPNEYSANLTALSTSMYVSAVTFTTLGYADVRPTRGGKPFAPIEAGLGILSISLLGAILAKGLWTGQ